MPTPARTSVEEIVDAASRILDDAGLTGLTMQAVAARVGVRPPSLYKRVRDRDELLGMIAAVTAGDLGERLTAAAAAASDDPAERLVQLAHALRAYAHARPERYRLVFAPPAETVALDDDARAVAVRTLLETTAELVGADEALPAARTVTAWATGFISMEFAGAFRLGGDVDDAFAYGIERIAAALGGGRAA
ncbi:WHG domain-containing protein [Microbacterium sp. LjRoot45]|uniref:TetR/AcrR family transcriptional regulator n=1 Tax=Microbacterium sp. LjRoot45 TaxID=3342329 RepID=UPI003ECE227F